MYLYVCIKINVKWYISITHIKNEIMEQPKKEKYGWHERVSFDDEPSGWQIEGGEEAYYEALVRWEFMKAYELGKQDMINDNTLPQQL